MSGTRVAAVVVDECWTSNHGVLERTGLWSMVSHSDVNDRIVVDSLVLDSQSSHLERSFAVQSLDRYSNQIAPTTNLR